MFGAPIVTVAPAAELISNGDAKILLRVDDTGFDVAVDLARTAAAAEIEQRTGLRLINQTVQVTADSFDDLALFRVGPVRAVTSVGYRDSAGVNQLVEPADYELQGAPLEQGLRLVADRWPTAEVGSIVVTLDVGYGADATAVPAPLLYAAYALMRGHFDGKDVDIEATIANHRLYLP